ncbi:type II secretion protein F [Pseudodesulfovibrio cashew]|uniref:Type II secretion protein F n=1 Tax=Pseudodesulfovibrio cashew TaxID=2678688 RepID=A0A6I6JMG2_9BACT|nr:type II secretion system F family protein [Pseudodesulfovibrio cashew]QGY38854.1 type II secretion protein F [Pseudodesulfovibrio cashew]
MHVTILVAIGCTVVIFLLVMSLGSLLRAGKEEANDKVQKRLRRFAMDETEAETLDLLLKHSSMSQVAWFNKILKNLRFAANLERNIKQADTKGSAGVYLLLCAVLGFAGFYGGFMASDKWWVGLILGGLLGYAPVAHVNRLKAKRMDRFQAQLPDALDLMSRALKAGHTFAGSMSMVAEEFDDPIGVEFRTTLEEINFGVDVDRAMGNLQKRVDVDDLKFFIVSVNIQRETGGNLAEIISNIARLVRERFVLFGKVRILSAEGRISALLLSALPFFITGVLFFINREYMSLLWTRELGRSMAWAGIISMAVGIVIMRRMVKIKV